MTSIKVGLADAGEVGICDHCEESCKHNLALSFTRYTPTGRPVTHTAILCLWCILEACQYVTGWKFPRQYESWRYMSEATHPDGTRIADEANVRMRLAKERKKEGQTDDE